MQATTTTIHTTRKFYETTFNMTKEEVASQIPFSNFSIPVNFPVISRVNDDVIRDHTKSNIIRIKRVYSYYCHSLAYNDKSLSKYDSIITSFDSDIWE